MPPKRLATSASEGDPEAPIVKRLRSANRPESSSSAAAASSENHAEAREAGETTPAASSSKKGKAGAQAQSKAKTAVSKSTQAKARGKGKSKYKAAVPADTFPAPSSPEEESMPQEPKKRVRKPPVARAAIWKDIPDWGDRKDSPLFRLPAEVLDLCFGTKLNVGLQMRDYVSLAGVSRYFRLHFTDTVFREIYLRSNPDFVPPRGHPHATFRSPIRPSELIFTRAIKDWRRPPPRKNWEHIEPFLRPRPPRASWKKKDWEFWTTGDKLVAELRHLWNKAQLVRADAARKAFLRNKPLKNVLVNGISRTVLAEVPGSVPGTMPGPKSERGIPIELDPAHAVTVEDDVPQIDFAFPAIADRMREIEVQLTNLRREYRKWRKSDRQEDGESTWELPEEEKIKQPTLINFNYQTGRIVTHDYYHSPWRKRAADVANGMWINRSDAIKFFKVSETELMCLRHLLVPNAINPKAPSSLYCIGAVQALALRSHGGPIGHHRFVEAAKAKASLSLSTRRAAAVALPPKPAPTSKQFHSKWKEDELAVNYGIYSKCNIWYWQGVFFDWIIDWEQRAATEQYHRSTGASADNDDDDDDETDQEEGGSDDGFSYLGDVPDEDDGGAAPGPPTGMAFPQLYLPGDAAYESESDKDIAVYDDRFDSEDSYDSYDSDESDDISDNSDSGAGSDSDGAVDHYW